LRICSLGSKNLTGQHKAPQERGKLCYSLVPREKLRQRREGVVQGDPGSWGGSQGLSRPPAMNSLKLSPTLEATVYLRLTTGPL
jgi:hypothetical protein